MIDPIISRRGFVKAGGALIVSLGIPDVFGGATAEAAAAVLDPTKLASWLEIRADNTIHARSGRIEIGVGMSAYYAQVVAEELRVPATAVSLTLGSTDLTPDGGSSANLLRGAGNLRKVAAYAYQALLTLAATELGQPRESLTVTGGVVSGGGKSISYGQLVGGRELQVTIPVTGVLPPIMDPADDTGVGRRRGVLVDGNPPVKPFAEYTVVGTSHPMPGTPDKVTGKADWVGDVRLDGLLHARMVRPATLGGTLVAVGALDKKQFPTARVVTKGNLVAVLSPVEWESVAASRAVALGTKWTDSQDLPGSDNVTATMRNHAWGAPSATLGDVTKVDAQLAGASKTLSATYEQPAIKHAPIGPYVAVADVRRDGVTVWTHSSQSHGLRMQIANTLGAPVDQVVVRWMPGSGQYGRTTWGGDGAEADAAILSQIVGQPVRVQWTLQEDLTWSTVSPAWMADMKAGLDANGRLIAVRHDWYAPHQNDSRLLGAVLAGMPTATPKVTNSLTNPWLYDQVASVSERAFAMPSIGAAAYTHGLRGNIMRTPWQRNQCFAVESLINEAAAAAGADAIEFRLNHTTDKRLIELIKRTAAASKWDTRSSPGRGVRRTGSAPLTGRGVAVMLRAEAYWVGIADIEVVPSTGQVRVTNFTIGADVGKVINPRQLRLIVQGGVVMGLSEALKEEVKFDRSKVTSTDWRTYPILTMAETPEIKTVLVSHDDRGMGTGGEAPNGLPPAAVAGAFFDATGVAPRRIPLTPAYVRTLLKGA